MKNTKFIRVYIIVVEKAMKQMLEKGLLVQSRIFRIVHCMLNQIPCYSVLIVTFFLTVTPGLYFVLQHLLLKY